MQLSSKVCGSSYDGRCRAPGVRERPGRGHPVGRPSERIVGIGRTNANRVAGGGWRECERAAKTARTNPGSAGARRENRANEPKLVGARRENRANEPKTGGWRREWERGARNRANEPETGGWRREWE